MANFGLVERISKFASCPKAICFRWQKDTSKKIKLAAAFCIQPKLILICANFQFYLTSYLPIAHLFADFILTQESKTFRHLLTTANIVHRRQLCRTFTIKRILFKVLRTPGFIKEIRTNSLRIRKLNG